MPAGAISISDPDHELDFDTDIAHFTERQMQVCSYLDKRTKKYILYGGAMGGGKSYLLRWMAIRLLMSFFWRRDLRYVQVMLACEDYPSLKDRQLSKISREIPEWIGRGHADHKDYGRCFILNDSFGSGVICFRNLDDPSKYASAEFAAILVDELTKNQMDTFHFLRTRIRWPGIPDIECPFIGATNPGGVGHGFVKSLWMDKQFPREFIEPIDYRPTFAYIPSKADDNPYLDEAYWNTLATLPPSLRAAFRDGSWDVFVGQMFQEWTPARHVIKPIPIPRHSWIYQTFDWGFGKPFSIGWWWVDADGRIYRFDEWYGWTGSADTGIRLTDPEIAEGIKKKEDAMGIAGRNIIRLAGHDSWNKKPDYKGGGQGKSTAEVFSEHGLHFTKTDIDRKLKMRQFHARLKVPESQDELPMMVVYENCEQFIRTIPNLVQDANNIEDIDTTQEDHVYDESALICLARPIELRIPAPMMTPAQAHIAMIEKPISNEYEKEAIAEKVMDERFWEYTANREHYDGRTYSDVDSY